MSNDITGSKRVFAGLLIALLMTPGLITNAKEYSSRVNNEDLEVGEQAIVPGNPFYFLKNWQRRARKIFITKPFEIILSQIEDLATKASEVNKLEEVAPKNKEVFKLALNRYQEGIEALEKTISKEDLKVVNKEEATTLNEKLFIHLRLTDDFLSIYIPSYEKENLYHSQQKIANAITSIYNQAGSIGVTQEEGYELLRVAESVTIFINSLSADEKNLKVLKEAYTLKNNLYDQFTNWFLGYGEAEELLTVIGTAEIRKESLLEMFDRAPELIDNDALYALYQELSLER
ncbi:MAG: hypothetical protein COU06_01685 [Candidatus Harrisonbacteria bacterium CG10_big_fil_rev_8_21_14_0_10_38_8]|uniref:DUF5667 domain-containing protein n=1 Tax=Candidatus Harrisonbacteria bacterium CG10_big_fil_rev_8_21_14_0_10_38_8 TaxID=1974582 RepID=A0A2M6WJX3_9BACT|nr:MAG: hypothetical protein COU06_01685 [Candidatus Harrisonbacteria bacterium CG10_big_fil_rev_8_21_14_0_10_38_8]